MADESQCPLDRSTCMKVRIVTTSWLWKVKK